MSDFLPPGLRVLVAEDELLIAEEIRHRLGRIGLRVIEVTARGEHAVELARELLPDMVLMDIRLKGTMDGVEAADEIGRLEIPVVFLTSHSDEATISRAVAASPYGYLLKPFREADLVVAISTALRRAASERFSRDRESLYAATLSSIADAVVATDMTGLITFVNRAAEALLGIDAGYATGRSVEAVVELRDAAERPWTLEAFQGALGAAEVVRSPPGVTLRAVGGRRVPVAVRVASVHDAQGARAGVVAVVEDLTMLERHAQELEHTREALDRAERMKAMGRLAGGVAHDFNNLLTIIAGCTAELRSSPRLGEEEAELVADILAATDRAAAITRHLLATSRRQVVAPRLVDLNQVVRGFGALVRRIAGEGVACTLSLDPERLPVLIDPGQLEEVVTNLAANAGDAMPEGGTLTLTTSRVRTADAGRTAFGALPAGSWVRLALRDTGEGVPAEALAHLTEPFYTTRAGGNRVGLGLATVADIVDQAGGYLDLVSEPGTGSEFIVYLPLAGDVVDEVEGPTTDDLEEPSPRVLLVEDEPAVLRLAARVLRSAGYTVMEAPTGEDAVAIAEAAERSVDALVTDVVMPGINGREVANRVAELFPSVAVVVMSGYTDDELLRQGIEAGQYSFLPKPFTPTELMEAVRGVLEQRKEGSS